MQTLDAIAKAEKSPVRDETTDRNPSYEWLRSELTKSNADLASLHARATETQSVIGQYRTQLGDDRCERGDAARPCPRGQGSRGKLSALRAEARRGADRRRTGPSENCERGNRGGGHGAGSSGAPAQGIDSAPGNFARGSGCVRGLHSSWTILIRQCELRTNFGKLCNSGAGGPAKGAKANICFLIFTR